MYRISVTTLEKFRRYMKGVSSFDTEESLIESLKGLFTGNDKTKFGSAYHKIIEGEFKSDTNSVFVISDNVLFSFTEQQAAPALKFRNDHPLMVHEMSISKMYDTAFFPIQVGGRIDGIEGREIRDTKTKFRSIDVLEYMDSSQWKFYLDMLDIDIFWYDLYEIRRFNDLPNTNTIIIPEEVQVIYHQPIKCDRYENMHDDLTSLLNDFLDYMHHKNFLHLLKPALIQETF